MKYHLEITPRSPARSGRQPSVSAPGGQGGGAVPAKPRDPTLQCSKGAAILSRAVGTGVWSDAGQGGAQGHDRRRRMSGWPRPRLSAAIRAAADPVDEAMEGLHAALSRARERYEGDPYANPIALMALELVQRMDADELRRASHRGADPAPDARGFRRPGGGTARAMSVSSTPSATATRSAACSPAWRRARTARPCRSRPSPRGSSGSTTASCSPPTRPSGGPWSCRPCSPALRSRPRPIRSGTRP